LIPSEIFTSIKTTCQECSFDPFGLLLKADKNPNNDQEQEFIDELKFCLEKGPLTDDERKMLDRMIKKLGISKERAGELEKEVTAATAQKE